MNITLDSADTATLAAGGEVTLTITGTKAAVVTPPVTTPPVTTPPVVTPPASGFPAITSPVFAAGKFDWAGDWNSQPSPMNYALVDTAPDGSSPVMEMAGVQQWEYWLPYPKQNSAGPATNGTNFPLAGLTHFTIAVKPAQAGGQLQMELFEASGGTDDIPVGNVVNITQAKYGPAAPPAGEWSIYTIPLTDFISPLPAWIYKFIIQQQGVTPMKWRFAMVGFG